MRLPLNSTILVCGAGIIPVDIVEKYHFINSHPGYIPYVRGLDALKWAIIEKKYIGVTTHLIGDEIDAGAIIERKIIPVYKNDTFHAVAYRQYEIEIGMLVRAVDLLKNGSMEYVSAKNNVVHKRMPKNIESNLLKKFEEYKNDEKINEFI